jgi:protein-tyrosine phosphatase
MKHVFWLMRGLVAGRPGPVLNPWDAKALYAGGLRVVLSLNEEPDPSELAVAGIRHHSLPWPPILPLTAALQDFLLDGLEEVLPVLHAEVDNGEPTLIHCHAGKDRTGLLMTAYLVRYQGLEIEEAIARVRAVRPIALSAPGYEATARRFGELERVRLRAAESPGAPREK